MSLCPCGSEKEYDKCCGPYIEGSAQPPTAEALMRSRYSAYAVGNIEYLKTTLLPERQEDHDEEAVRKWAETSEWVSLSVSRTRKGGEDDDTGEVTFAARFRQNNMVKEHREQSLFKKVDGKWYYEKGFLLPPETVRNEAKVGRNEPCPCGSGKKFKKCCGK